MTSDNDLNRAIDDVAREMTAGDADRNLRVRVLSDIERPRPFAWRPVFATACAAGALIALIIVARGRPPSSTIGPTPSTNRAAVSARGPAPSAIVPAPSGNVPPSPIVQTRSTNAPALAAGMPPSRAPLSPNPFAEAPLEEAPLTVEPMVVAPIAPAELTGSEQLPSIAPISVAPLDVQGESK